MACWASYCRDSESVRPTGLAAPKRARGGGFAEDGDARRAGAVGGIDRAAGDQRDAHGLEVARRNVDHAREVALPARGASGSRELRGVLHRAHRAEGRRRERSGRRGAR